jgi:cytochrome c oxidase cbb3-type subunit III
MVAVLSCAVAMSCLFGQETNRGSEKAKQLNQSLSQAGRQTFESTCASCHGLDGKGGERGPDIATRSEVVRLSDEEISKILRTGIQSGMPSFAALGSAKLSATLNHLRFLQGKGAAPTLPGNSGKGKELFAGKAGCSECHMVQGLGGFLGPDLSNYGASHSASDIRGAIVSPDKRSGSRKALAKATTKDGQTVSGLVRNEDNFSLQLQSLDGALHFLTKSDLAELTFGSKPLMPEDYTMKLSERELDQVVAYLLSVAHVRQERRKVISKTRKEASNEE